MLERGARRLAALPTLDLSPFLGGDSSKKQQAARALDEACGCSALLYGLTWGKGCSVSQACPGST